MFRGERLSLGDVPTPVSEEVDDDGLSEPPSGGSESQFGDNNKNDHDNIRRRQIGYVARIQNDLDNGRSARYTVPDPSTLPKGRSLFTVARKKVDPARATDYDSDDENTDSPEGWINVQVENCVRTVTQRTWKDWFVTFFPLYTWLAKYSWRENLVVDVLAGLAVGVMVVPQSMSYAKLAGLPVQYGLYSALVPIYAYAIFGSSRQLAVGPVALVSLMVNSGITGALERKDITPDNTDDYDTLYAGLALQTAVVVGLLYIIMGWLRLGFATMFLSHAVTSGFTSGASIIIALSQVKSIFGISIPNGQTLQESLKNIVVGLRDQPPFNWRVFILGTVSIATLMSFKKLSQLYPKTFKWSKAMGPLFITIVTVVLQATVDLEAKGIPIVGFIPSGFPSFTGTSVFPMTLSLGDLAIPVLSIAIVGFMESVAIAKQFASKHNYKLDPSMELIGLGMANLGSGLFGGYPVTGSFSRSAVNNDSGATSGISAIVTATFVGMVLLCLTSVFELMPIAVLGAIVIAGVISLLDYPEAIYLWKVHKFDFGVWMFAFLGVLFLGIELGLGIAVAISILIVIYESAYPHTAILGRLPGTHQYRNIKQYRDAEVYDEVVMVRIDSPLYFANAQNVCDKIAKYVDKANKAMESKSIGDALEAQSRSVRWVILEISAVSHIDTSALHILHEVAAEFGKKRKIHFCLADPNRIVMKRLASSGFADEIGRDRIFVSLHDALQYCLNELDNVEDGEGSPNPHQNNSEESIDPNNGQSKSVGEDDALIP